MVRLLKNQGRRPDAEDSVVDSLLKKRLIRLHRKTWWALTPRGFDIAQRDVLLRSGLLKPPYDAILD
jgi:hypothetical protein